MGTRTRSLFLLFLALLLTCTSLLFSATSPYGLVMPSQHQVFSSCQEAFLASDYVNTLNSSQLLTLYHNKLQQEEAAAAAAQTLAATATPTLNERIPIFYNLFIGKEEDRSRVQALMNEQFQFWNETIHGDVYITSIGVPPTNLTYPLRLREQRRTGDEVVTLDALWEYCQSNPSSKVIYLHSKGSFHPTKVNDVLRNFLTRGALSTECANLPNDATVCSSRMSPFPHTHTSGNMWLARCSYVQLLEKPSTYQETLGGANEPCVGMGRFAAEHYIHSHPACRPVDLYTQPDFIWAYDFIPSLEDFEAAMDLAPAPRFIADVYVAHPPCNDGKLRLQRHVLEEFQRIYNQTPAADWWGWKFYNGTEGWVSKETVPAGEALFSKLRTMYPQSKRYRKRGQ